VRPDAPWPGLRSGAALLAVSAFWLSLIGWTLASAQWLRPVGLALLGAACLMMWRHARRQGSHGATTPRRPSTRPAASAPAAASSSSTTSPASPAAPADVAADATHLTSATQSNTAAPSAHLPPGHWDAGVLRAIEWRRFEAVCEALWRQDGHRVSAPPGRDSGVDLVLHPAVGGDRIERVMQCRHGDDSPVGPSEVRALRGAMADLGVDSALCVSSARFAPDARAFAQRNGITPVDGADLLLMLVNRPELQQRQLLAIATQGEYWRPTCARCGAKMTERAEVRGAWECTPPCPQQLQWRGDAA
jgi:restriction system protein